MLDFVLSLQFAGGVSLAEVRTKKVKSLASPIVGMVDAQDSLLQALASVKDERDLPVVEKALISVSSGMRTTVSEVRKISPLSLTEKRGIHAILSRREYELFPNRSMEISAEPLIKPKEKVSS